MVHQDFEKYAEEKQFNYSVPEKFQENFNRCIANLKLPLPSIKILDFGCGDGKHYNFFVQKGLLPTNIYGVEISKKRIERCQSIGWEKSYFIENERLPFTDDEFDIINMAEVIEHIPSDKIENIFLDLIRVIKKNGFLIITTPNYPIKRFYDIMDAFVGKKWERLRDDPTHINHYNVRKLRNFLGKYFNSMKIVPYKNGFLFNKFKNNLLLHKMLAICSNKKQI
jgi:SAM-dependent methyltransferase